MTSNTDLITYTETGDVDVLALVRARAAATAARTTTVPAQRTTGRRYTQPVGSGARIGDTTPAGVTFEGMDGDLAVYTGINL